MAQRRHAAHRIWVRLTTEEGVEVGESTVRDHVRALREELGRSDADGYLDQRRARPRPTSARPISTSAGRGRA